MLKKILPIAILVLLLGGGYLYIKSTGPDTDLLNEDGPVSKKAVLVVPQSESLDVATFEKLLTHKDVVGVLREDIVLVTSFSDLKDQAVAIDPEQAQLMKMWYASNFRSEDGLKSIILDIVDLDSKDSRDLVFQETKSEIGLSELEIELGEDNYGGEINDRGVGAALVFAIDNKIVRLHTSMPGGELPLADFPELIELAQIVEGRL